MHCKCFKTYKIHLLFQKLLIVQPLREFSRIFENFSKTLKANPHSHLEILTLNLKNIALVLTSNFEGF